MELVAGTDFRKKRYRREVFHRFYSFHLRYRSHPGCVYYVLPHLADVHGWDEEQRAWAAFLNGNTQNPVTTLLLMRAGDRPAKADAVVRYWRQNYERLEWDTDRRYHKSKFDQAVSGYLRLVGSSQHRYWARAAKGGWAGVWKAGQDVPTMGRLSTWSYLEYVKLMGVASVPDADTLMLDDIAGSKSHRNGLLFVLGLDEWMDWKPNKAFPGKYPKDLLRGLAAEGEQLLREAKRRNPGQPDVGYLTLESALCTYKSWHRPNRRYAGVYNDMLHDRLRKAESVHGKAFGEIWDARRKYLPRYLRMEATPGDPGCVPVKQNHYLRTGQVIVLDHEWPEFANDLTPRIASGELAGERRWQ